MARVVRRVSSALGGLVVAGIVAGAVYQWFSTKQDMARHPAPGDLVEIGDHRLHIWCSGVGDPTVVFESGLGGSSVDWGVVQPSVARFTRACAYDRAGLGYSDPGPSPRTSERIVRELLVLLNRVGVTRPIVLVGASIGGFSARVFATVHEDRTAGLVLVDASHEDQSLEVPAVAPFAPLLASLGVFRFLGISFTLDPDRLAPNVRDYSLATRFRTSVYSAAASEVMHARESAGQVRATRRVLSVPLVVVTGGYGNSGGWKELQEDQLRLSSSSCQLIADRSGHTVPIDQPDAVVRAIHIVVDAARSHAKEVRCQ